MEYGDIKFLVSKSLNKEESLNISLNIKDVNLRDIQFYKGKTKIKMNSKKVLYKMYTKTGK